MSHVYLEEDYLKGEGKFPNRCRVSLMICMLSYLSTLSRLYGLCRIDFGDDYEF
jgi:hypothetical protein